MSENKNQSAFPSHYEYSAKWGGDAIQAPGLTKREYFAGLAMQGLLSTLSPGLYDSNTIAAYAYEAVKAADYLMEELSNS